MLAVSSVLATAITYLLYQRLSRPVETAYVDAANGYGLEFFARNGQRITARRGEVALVLDPFTFFANYPRQHTRHFTIDEQGLRGGIRDLDKPRVFVLGGSAAFGYGLDNDDETMTARLNGDVPSRTFVDAAVIGYLSGQEAVQMIMRVDRLRPAAYVVLDGWNDFADSLQKPPFLGVNAEFEWLADALVEHNVTTDDTGTARRRFKGGAADDEPENARARVREVYLENLERMSTWARARNAWFEVLLQPLVNDREHATPDEAKWRVQAELSAGYRAFVESAVQFCELHDIRCCDVARQPEFQSDGRPLFFDAIHPNAAGHEVLARIVEREMQGVVLAPPPPIEAR